MTSPIFRATEDCWQIKCSEELRDDLFIATLIADPLLFITSLVLSILALTGVIGIPPAAAYGLMSLSSGIVLLYILSILKICYCSEKNTSDLNV